MTEKKRKNRDETRNKNDGDNKLRKQSNSKSRNHGSSGRNNTKEAGRKKKGPQLPNKLRKEIDEVNRDDLSNSENENDYNVMNDVYEYEETLPEEESKKNRRYDPVENYEYELPEEFKDEDVPSDDEDIGSSDEDDGRHSRMLQGITGLPIDAFEGEKRKSHVVVSEAYPESEYNPSRDVLGGDSRISIEDLLDPLREKSGFSKVRKIMNRMEKHSMSIQAPLSKPDQEKLERKAAYGQTRKDITKWNPAVKKNREAATLYFDADTELNFSTVGAIASEFEPRTDFEKKMASLVNDNQVAEAHKNDGAKLLELNKISVEDVKNRQEHLAKMRSLLFRHEMKSKRIKKIKSKTYRNLLRKDRMKATAGEVETDPEAAKELARNQEFKRAEERLTQKHKNSSKWAKRILKRGLSVQDEGTRTAISDQLHEHTRLTRKMRTMKEGSSSEDSSDDEDDDLLAESDEDGPSKLLEKAKEKTLEALEDDELPKSGVFSLPFMTRGLKKNKEEAEKEAKLALQEYELSLKQLEDKTEEDSPKSATKSGRRVFGASKKKIPESSVNKIKKSNDAYGNRDCEDEEIEAKNEDDDVGNGRQNYHHKDVNIDPEMLRDDLQISHDPIFKGFEDIAKNPGPKTTYEVAVFASDSWKKNMNLPSSSENTKNANEFAANSKNIESVSPDQDMEEVEDESDTDGEGNMVDGILTAGSKSTYELPSQTDLIKRAFAGDDVEGEFEEDKDGILNEENPEPEKPVLLPGWGQWTHIQKKKGLPSWMLEEHALAKKKRDEALKMRKDANLKHVIISEKIDKKAEKLHTKTLPFPFTSKEVFEQSIRMPIGPEFNPATAIGDLNRPEIVKKAGVIIKPIKYKELNSHEKGADDRKRSARKHKNKTSTKSDGKKTKKPIKAIK